MNTNISVTVPINQAIDRVKRLLFRPFDLGKWFVIGFTAWLAHLGEQGFSGNFNFPSGDRGDDIRRTFEQAKEFVMNNLVWIVPLVIAIVAVSFVIGTVLLWLKCRGQFMFLHCVANEKAEVAVPWHKFAREGNSMFGFRFVLGLIAMVLTLPVLVVIGISIWRMFQRGEPDVAGVVIVVACALVLIVVCVVFAVIGKFATDFVVPIMFLRRIGCLAAWREFRGLLSANVSQFVVYLLFQIVLAMAIGVMVLIAIIVTCCCACCLMSVPYIGAVLLLPVHAFKRAYSLHYLAQYGREYDVFPVPTL